MSDPQPEVREVTIKITYRVTMQDIVWRRPVENIDGWRDVLYDLSTVEDVAGHLAWNMGLHNRDLTSLDGFADLSDDLATVEQLDVEYE